MQIAYHLLGGQINTHMPCAYRIDVYVCTYKLEPHDESHHVLGGQMFACHTVRLANMALIFEQRSSEFANVLHSDHRHGFIAETESDRSGLALPHVLVTAMVMVTVTVTVMVTVTVTVACKICSSIKCV